MTAAALAGPRLRGALSAVWLAGALAAASAAAQGDVVAARGVVTDTSGRPVAGASVQLRRSEAGASQPAPTRTDDRGRWRVAPLGPGRWELQIRAPGFININGWVTVPPDGSPAPVEAQMLPLSWEPPAFGESPHTMLLWIEKGNSLLEQDRPAEAREIYGRALEQLPRGRRPEVLRGIARTHFVEGEVGEAIEALRRALEIDPQDQDSRVLYAMLMQNEGRGAQAQAVLAELDARPPAPEPAEEPAPRPVPISTPPEVLEELAAEPSPPLPDRVGRYKVAFEERAPVSRLDDYVARVGGSAAEIRRQDPGAGAYELAAESFQVSVPHGYARGEGWGLLVWISPTPYGGTRSEETAAALARHRLIWVGANRAGNERPVWDRILLALDAAHNMRALYDLDAERIYVGGYSGGGRAASRIGVLYPEIVRGAWSLYGCDYFRALPLVERPGASWPAKYEMPPRETLQHARENRFVLVTGPRDFNFTQTRSTARAMEEDGFRRVSYLEIPGADHFTFPDGEWLDRIFAALDGRDAAGAEPSG